MHLRWTREGTVLLSEKDQEKVIEQNWDKENDQYLHRIRSSIRFRINISTKISNMVMIISGTGMRGGTGSKTRPEPSLGTEIRSEFRLNITARSETKIGFDQEQDQKQDHLSERE